MDALNSSNKLLFISYSRRQTAWCDRLDEAIDKKTPYQRWRDNKISTGADWWASICRNIEGCFALIAVLTQDYLDSPYCMGELNYAKKLNKPIIILKLQDVDSPLDKQRIQFAKVENLDMSEVLLKVITACNQTLEDYRQGKYSTDISLRPDLRPPVPSQPDEAEDEADAKKVAETIDNLATPKLVQRFREVFKSNPTLGKDLLDTLSKRSDVPVYFDIGEAYNELTVAKEDLLEAERIASEKHKADEEYRGLVNYVKTLETKRAIAAIERFINKYPTHEPAKQLLQDYLPTVKTLLPSPFDWIDIPEQDYAIAKYPITNAQYAKFIEKDGYSNPDWWTKDGWDMRQAKSWVEPRYWQDNKWKGSEQPVVGVSWYEAVAFCLWLSAETNKKIMLPSEDQWQYAAQGNTNNIYPWGNDWNCQNCNNSVDPCENLVTTPVRQYAGKGDSVYDIVDMAGNVWEWCVSDSNGNTDYNTLAQKRVLKGGCWRSFEEKFFHFDTVNHDKPEYGSYIYGFRIALY